MNALLEAQRLLENLEYTRKQNSAAKPNAEGATRNPYSQELTPDDLADLESMRQMHALEDQIQAAQDDNGIGVAVDNQKLDEYHKMLASAQKLHEEETQRQEERKRRKEQRNAEMFERKQKVEAEATRIKAWADRRATCSTELSRLFSDLQAVSSDNNLGLRCPELVVVGMQSDGKSTFVEALLGFSFNIVSSNIGTRRPLIISMVNSRTYAEPCCRFRLENVPAGASGADEFENKPTPVERLSDEIQRRTNDVAGSDKSRVSSKPIFLRVEYSNCANLTIYDTPGFRLHGDERLASEIHDMVIDLIRPPERIIVCLEQSTVEWANTSSRRLVQQVDPDYSRTILLHTKFDNRIKELRSADEGLKYLHGEGLPRDDIPNFFISLPVARDLPPPAFREAVNSCYLQDFAHLQRIGIEDKQILAKLGFCRVEAFLERQMTRRYQAAFLPTLESLERGVAEMTTRIETLDRNIAQKDPNVMRQRAAHYVNVVTGMIERLLTGSAVGDPEIFGQTLQQERSQVVGASWSALDLNFPIENSNRKLYGGPQFHRLVNEFSWIAHAAELPHITIDEVASAMGTNKSHNFASYEAAASDLVQLKAKHALKPLLDAVTQRALHITGRLFDVATAVVQREDIDMSMIAACEGFTSVVRAVYVDFLKSIHQKFHAQLLEDVKSFTEVLDCWGLDTDPSSSRMQELAARALAHLETKEADAAIALLRLISASVSVASDENEATRARVVQIMSIHDSQMIVFPAAGRQVDEKTYRAFLVLCRKLFDRIRFKVVELVRNKLSTSILKPMFEAMRETVVQHFRSIPPDSFSAVFEAGTVMLGQERATLQRKLAYTTALRDQFRAASAKFHTAQQNQKTVEI